MDDRDNIIDGFAADRWRSEANVRSQLEIIQIVESSEFFRGCLVFWLRASCPEFEIADSPDLEPSFEPASARRIAAVVVGPGTFQRMLGWDQEEFARFQLRPANVPVVAIVTNDLASQPEGWVDRLSLRGYIPNSSNTEVASAALRLVIAGGTYFPRNDTDSRSGGLASTDTTRGYPLNHLATKLTLRERDVFERLGQGAPNKIIAYELNMSLSTVKAHVHSIIQKFNVRNRTEAVVAARALPLRIPPIE